MSSSRANQALRSLANAGFQNQGVCLQAFPSFPSPSPLFHFLPLVSFLARPKTRISFLGLSLLRNNTETLATQHFIGLFMTAVDRIKCRYAHPGITSGVGGFQNPGVCLQAFPSFLPHALPAYSRHFSRGLCSETARKRLLRRLEFKGLVKSNSNSEKGSLKHCKFKGPTIKLIRDLTQ